MAGDPAPLAAVQAAVLKTAAGKQAAQDPGIVAQNSAVAQDLAVMADQAKGYTAGVNQGTIVAQDNRAAQNRRLAQEAAQAAAERQRAVQIEQAQTERMRVEGEAAAQRDQFQVEQERAQQAANPPPANEAFVENALSVSRHAAMNRGPRFQEALAKSIGNATSADEAVAILENAARHDLPWATGIKSDVLRRYAQQYFGALEGKAVSSRVLSADIKPATSKPKSWLTTGLESAVRSRG